MNNKKQITRCFLLALALYLGIKGLFDHSDFAFALYGFSLLSLTAYLGTYLLSDVDQKGDEQ